MASSNSQVNQLPQRGHPAHVNITHSGAQKALLRELQNLGFFSLGKGSTL